MSEAQQSPLPPPTPISLTPRGTSTIEPGLPATLTPEVLALLGQAYQSLPPGAAKTLIRQLWPYLAGALIPLLLAAYGTITQLLNAPASISAVEKVVKDHGAEIEEIKASLKIQNDKIDKILWYMQAGKPSSRPVP